MSRVKRITVKIGSNVLADANGGIDLQRLGHLVHQMAELHRHGIEVILVSSGSILTGRSELRLAKHLDVVSSRQVYSAVGQAKLIGRYYELFLAEGIHCGQVLTTKESFETRSHYLNQKNCITQMLAEGIVPVVNENDTISLTELMFTDNDELSGLMASMMNVDALVILSNIDGIYDGNPSDPSTQVIRKIGRGKSISQYIQETKSKFGRGGMSSKAGTAQKVADEGIEVIIANGKRNDILTDLILEEKDVLCTRFEPAEKESSNVKKWIAHSEGFAKGELRISPKAVEAVTSADVARSLLPIGVVSVTGEFEKNDIVRICDEDGNYIGVGLSRYDSRKIRQLAGKKGEKPVVHYDYMFISDTNH